MKFCITAILLFFISFQSFSQTWEKLNDSITIYSEKGDSKKALLVAQKAVLAAKKQFGENHHSYALSLSSLGAVYYDMGEYAKAEPLYIQSADILKKEKDKDFEYYDCLNNLARLYNKMGKYELAESLYIQLLEILKKTSGDENTEYATILNNLAELYRTMAQDIKAEPLFLQAKDIFKNSTGEESFEYSATLNNIGLLYTSMGQYIKAEPFFLQAMKIFKNKSGEESLEYATCLNNIALLYIYIGQYENAQPLFLQAINIFKNTYGKGSLEHANSLNNLAGLYNKMGKYELAESLYIQAKDIFKNKLGEKNTAYALSLNNLALLYIDMGKYELAESLYLQSKDIFRDKLGEENTNYANSLNNLGLFYLTRGQYQKAEPLFIQAKEINRKVLGEKHPTYATNLKNLGELYESMGQYEKTEPLLLIHSQITYENLKNTFTILSEKEKGNYLSNNIALVETNNSFVYNYRKASPSVLRNNFNLQLFFKSLTLADTRNILASVQQSKDTAVLRLLNNWQTGKSILAKQYSLPITDRRADLNQIEAQTEDLEKELSRRSAAFRNQQKAISISLQDVQQNLQPDEAAVEFVSFRLFDRQWTDSTMYVAYVLKKNDPAPAFIPLCEEKQLQQLFDKALAASLNSDIDERESARVDSLYGGNELYNLLWQPLEPYLKGIKKISYSPAGKLYGIAFHALQVDSTTLLMDKYQLQQYSSTRQVALRGAEEPVTKPTSIVLFGNASFTMDSMQLVKQKLNQPSIENVSTSIIPAQKRSSDNATWVNLPGTATEVNAIQQLFEKNKISTQVFVQTAASEENLKALNGHSPQILHLATHGFSLPLPDTRKKERTASPGNTYTLADDPLLRSGLMLAGCNYAWSGKTPIAGIEDGIVTAYEISQLNLSNTGLVVLSACESALGDIKRSEGVFGLQRSFKMAGVKKMVVSMWQVPDKETAELMTSFYGYRVDGKSITDAFRLAQDDMRKKTDGDIYLWAAFVLVE